MVIGRGEKIFFSSTTKEEEKEIISSCTVSILGIRRFHLNRMMHSWQSFNVVQGALSGDSVFSMKIGYEATTCRRKKKQGHVGYQCIIHTYLKYKNDGFVGGCNKVYSISFWSCKFIFSSSSFSQLEFCFKHNMYRGEQTNYSLLPTQ